MKKQITNLCKKLSESFGHAAEKIKGEKHTSGKNTYDYLQSGNHLIMAAHGLSVTHCPYNENPVFHSEVNRKTANILYRTKCEPEMVAAMLLQDFVHTPLLNKKDRDITNYQAAVTLFDRKVINCVDEYKRLNDNIDKPSHIASSLVGVRMMKLASYIESMDRHLETTRQFIEQADKDIDDTKQNMDPNLEGVLFIKQVHYCRALEETEFYLDTMQNEFDDLRIHNPMMNDTFKHQMKTFRKLIKDWKTENSFDGDQAGPRNLLKEPYMKL